jgi:hypothetical protein
MMRSQARPASGLAPGRCGCLLAAPAHRCSGASAGAAALAATAPQQRWHARLQPLLALASDARRAASGAECSTSGRNEAGRRPGATWGPTSGGPRPRSATLALAAGGLFGSSSSSSSSSSGSARAPQLAARAWWRGGGGGGGDVDGAGPALAPPGPRPVVLSEVGRDKSGAPLYELLDPDDFTELDPAPPTDDLMRDLDGIDVGGPADVAAAAVEAEEAEVPAMRVIDDPVELDLIGDGLPIIHGVRRRPGRRPAAAGGRRGASPRLASPPAARLRQPCGRARRSARSASWPARCLPAPLPLPWRAAPTALPPPPPWCARPLSRPLAGGVA